MGKRERARDRRMKFEKKERTDRRDRDFAGSIYGSERRESRKDKFRDDRRRPDKDNKRRFEHDKDNERRDFRKRGEERTDFKRRDDERRDFRKMGEERTDFKRRDNERHDFRRSGEERTDFKRRDNERRDFRRSGEERQRFHDRDRDSRSSFGNGRGRERSFVNDKFKDKRQRFGRNNDKEFDKPRFEKKEPIRPLYEDRNFDAKPRFSDKSKQFDKERRDFSHPINDERFGNATMIRGRLYSISKDGLQWYGEIVKKSKGEWLREWDAKKSKIAAAIKKGFRFNLTDQSVLYLGSSTGTTVSHISDLTTNTIVGVDIAPIVMREFLLLSEKRHNIIPLLYDASKLSECELLKEQKFDLVFEDIAQRNMVEIFIENFKVFSKPSGEGWLSLKTRSIDSTVPSERVYNQAIQKIQNAGLNVKKTFNLEPFEKEHYFIVVGF